MKKTQEQLNYKVRLYNVQHCITVGKIEKIIKMSIVYNKCHIS